jgi:hypothetical protein
MCLCGGRPEFVRCDDRVAVTLVCPVCCRERTIHIARGDARQERICWECLQCQGRIVPSDLPKWGGNARSGR